MTTEVLAALRYGPSMALCTPYNDNTRSMAYRDGEIARAVNQALLANPYTRDTVAWTDWRQGWLDHDGRIPMFMGRDHDRK